MEQTRETDLLCLTTRINQQTAGIRHEFVHRLLNHNLSPDFLVALTGDQALVERLAFLYDEEEDDQAYDELAAMLGSLTVG